jgi:integrase/recombinase XerC
MKLQDALARFLVQFEADGRSPHTQNQYRRHVTAFAAWLPHGGPRRAVAAIGHEDVARFLAAPVARTSAHGGMKTAVTLNAMRTSLRMFWRYCHESGLVPENPARLVRRAICSPPPPRALPDADCARLLKLIAAVDDVAARRDHALFHLLVATGIRVGSCVALSVEDVDFAAGEIHLGTMKGSRRDTVYLNRTICAHLRRYLGDRTSGALFPGRGSERITARHVQRRLAGWLRSAAIKTPASPHWFRHAAAMRIYKATSDLAVVQAALCHRSITSTLVYARVDAGRVRAAMA